MSEISLLQKSIARLGESLRVSKHRILTLETSMTDVIADLAHARATENRDRLIRLERLLAPQLEVMDIQEAQPRCEEYDQLLGDDDE